MQLKEKDYKVALKSAVEAARETGQLLRRNLNSPKKINEAMQHDIKLELDVRCQKLIEKRLQAALPGVALLGEEGILGNPESGARWVVDPIDGTVNFTYGIPHACISIALQVQTTGKSRSKTAQATFETVMGMVYDPFCDELWTALRGGPARLNGRVIQASKRRRLDEAIVSIGFAKNVDTLEQMLPTFNQLVHQVRKIRIMGAAALAMVYVASGRFDAYMESGVRLWDIAAGGLILECAGGEFWNRPLSDDHRYQVIANNGLLRRKLQAKA